MTSSGARTPVVHRIENAVACHMYGDSPRRGIKAGGIDDYVFIEGCNQEKLDAMFKDTCIG